MLLAIKQKCHPSYRMWGKMEWSVCEALNTLLDWLVLGSYLFFTLPSMVKAPSLMALVRIGGGKVGQSQAPLLPLRIMLAPTKEAAVAKRGGSPVPGEGRSGRGEGRKGQKYLQVVSEEELKVMNHCCCPNCPFAS